MKLSKRFSWFSIVAGSIVFAPGYADIFIHDGSQGKISFDINKDGAMVEVNLLGLYFGNYLKKVNVVSVKYSGKVQGKPADVEYSIRCQEGSFESDSQYSKIAMAACKKPEVSGKISQRREDGKNETINLSAIKVADNGNILSGWLIGQSADTDRAGEKPFKYAIDGFALKYVDVPHKRWWEVWK